MPMSDETDKISAERCMATVMGHASRIWDVRFLVSNERLDLLSFGEDGTAQAWQLIPQASVEGLPSRGLSNLSLVHQRTYAYHVGKNLWAGAHFRHGNGTHMIGTGGADGRIVSYNIRHGDNLLTGQHPTSRWTIEDVAAQLERTKTFPSASTQLSDSYRLFKALHGKWAIGRTIKSSSPTYPSGKFKGEATFERRPPSAEEYHDEYLYSENGTFEADLGLIFQASRQYAYRYHASSDVISAWFVKPDDRSTVDYLFHELRMENSRDVGDRQAFHDKVVLKARAYHLCVDDHYTPNYNFRLKDGFLDDWSLTYHVKGPQKDYLAEACYTRAAYHDDEAEEQDTMVALPPSTNCNNSQPGDWEFEKDDFKSYVFLHGASFLVTTAQGRVLRGSLDTPAGNHAEVETSDSRPRVSWEAIDQSEALKSSSITTKAVGSEMILLSGNNGTVFTYDIPKKQISSIFDLGRKAAYVYAQNLHEREVTQELDFQAHLILVTSLGRPKAYVIKYANPEVHDLKKISLLTLQDSFIVTSASYIEAFDMWILGSRNGRLAFYDGSQIATDNITGPCSILPETHGKDAINIIRCLREPELDQPAYILTTGRDGYYALHTLSISRYTSKQPEVQFHTVQRSTPPFGPNIEGASVFEDPDRQSCNLILWGFRSTQFVVWNASKDQETMVVDCGGAHRNWSYCPNGDGGSDGGTFAWTQASVCNIHSQKHASHQVFQPGGHGREIKAMAISPPVQAVDGSINRYIATGAEDTRIRIWSFDHRRGSDMGFRCWGTWTKHTTGIQQLHWSQDGRLLFSAAGCEEFFAWRVLPVPFISIGAIFHYTSHPTNSHFTLLQTTTYGTNCLTAIIHLPPLMHRSKHSYLCTASSDGHLAFWPADPISIYPPSEPDPDQRNNIPLTFSHRHRIHQSTIKCISAIAVSATAQNEFVVLSGGDDGALGVTRLTLPFGGGGGGEPPKCETLLYPKAHAAAINGIAYMTSAGGSSHTFATSGNDQRVKMWGVECAAAAAAAAAPGVVPGAKGGLRLMKKGDRPTTVGDVAAVCAMMSMVGRWDDRREEEEEEGIRVLLLLVVAGIGMECLGDWGEGEGLMESI
ncbi:MAG: hypothetical protein Q9185_005376 [Variospora sp. 1 TL-2023]